MEFLTKFLDYLLLEKNYSPHTLTAYKKDIVDFFKFIEQEYQISKEKDVVHVYVRSWIVTLHQRQISNRTINRKITALKSYYAFLLKVNVVEKSPLAHQKKLKTAKKIILPFSEQEVSEAMQIEENSYTDFEQQRNKLIIHFLYATGIRQVELLNLQLQDINLENKTIKVLGKRNKERIIPIYDEIYLHIKVYLKARGKVDTDENYLFLTKKGAKIYNALVYRIINSYFSKVSTKQKKSPHVLRHSYATDLVKNGADLNSVKELLGHSSLAATQVYTHNSLDKLKRVYNQAHPRGAKKK